MLDVVKLALLQLQPAGSPKCLRSLGILEQRVAALDQRTGEHTMKAAAVVITLANQVEEERDMLWRFVRRKLDPETTHLGFDDRFDLRRILSHQQGREEKEQSSKLEPHFNSVH